VELSNPVISVDHSADRGGIVLQQRVHLAVFDNRISHIRVASWILRIHLGWPSRSDKPETAFPQVPSQIRSGGHAADFFNRVLTDIGHEHVPIPGIPENTLAIAHAIGIDLSERFRFAVTDKWI